MARVGSVSAAASSIVWKRSFYMTSPEPDMRERRGVRQGSLRRDYDGFLFACLKRDGERDVTMVSALACLGHDPWLVAEQLARLSKKQAATRLTGILSQSTWLDAKDGSKTEIMAAVEHLSATRRLPDQSVKGLLYRPHAMALIFIGFNLIAFLFIMMVATAPPHIKAQSAADRLTEPQQAGAGDVQVNSALPADWR